MPFFFFLSYGKQPLYFSLPWPEPTLKDYTVYVGVVDDDSCGDITMDISHNFFAPKEDIYVETLHF